MRTSTDRILTTHVGSIPRPDTVRELVRARVEGRPVDADVLAARVREAVVDVVKKQAECGIDVVSDGEMSKATFIAYADERLTGFTVMRPDDPGVPASNTSGAWERRLDTRREWRAFRDYYAA